MSTLQTKFGVKAVGAGLTTVTVTFATDEVAASGAQFPAGATVSAICVPDWATSVRITAISVTAVTFTFGTNSGGYGGNIYWMASGR